MKTAPLALAGSIIMTAASASKKMACCGSCAPMAAATYFAAMANTGSAPLSDGQSTNIEDFWDAGIYAGIVELELFYASGGSTLTSAGVFTLSMTCGELAISGSVSHDWFDPYDWHADLSAYIPGFGSVSDADAIRLQEAGRAAEFDMKSQWKQDLHWNQDTQSFEWK